MKKTRKLQWQDWVFILAILTLIVVNAEVTVYIEDTVDVFFELLKSISPVIQLFAIGLLVLVFVDKIVRDKHGKKKEAKRLKELSKKKAKSKPMDFIE